MLTQLTFWAGRGDRLSLSRAVPTGGLERNSWGEQLQRPVESKGHETQRRGCCWVLSDVLHGTGP